METTVEIKFDHRIEEHLHARRLYYARRSKFAIVDRIVALVLLAVGIAGVIFVGVRWWTVIWLVLGPLEWFNLLTLEPLVVRFYFKRSPRFRGTTTLKFGEEAIRYQTASIDSTLGWDLFSGLLEDENVFLLLYAAPRQYAIVPKRAFSSSAEQTRFRDLATRKICS